MLIEINSPAPDFELPDQNGQLIKLSDYQGFWVLLYFYPKDDTTGCTIEACTIRDHFPEFQGVNAKVLGISIDSVESHKNFAKKHKLPFSLLADTNKAVVQQYGVWVEKNMMGKKFMGTVRTSYLIDPQGKIIRVYPKVNPRIHAQKVYDDIVEIQKTWRPNN